MWAEVMENRAGMGGGSGLLTTQTVSWGLSSCSYPDTPNHVLSLSHVPLLTSSQTLSTFSSLSVEPTPRSLFSFFSQKGVRDLEMSEKAAKEWGVIWSSMLDGAQHLYSCPWLVGSRFWQAAPSAIGCVE